jgi:hypothetical protein
VCQHLPAPSTFQDGNNDKNNNKYSQEGVFLRIQESYWFSLTAAFFAQYWAKI